MAKKLNALQQITNAFKIPNSVAIVTDAVLGIREHPISTKSESFSIDNTQVTDPELYRSSLGTPVFTNLEFLEGTYETEVNNIVKFFQGVKYEAVLLTVNQAKKIVRTEIQGRNGTVKEYIGLDDYEITINGIITGTNGVRPVEEVARLKAILDAPIAVGVASAYLQSLGIDQIVISSYQLEQSEGGYSYQTFSINALSDVPQELRLTDV